MISEKYHTIIDNNGSEATFKLEDISLVSIPSQFAIPFGKGTVQDSLAIIQIYGQVIQMKPENARSIRDAMFALEKLEDKKLVEPRTGAGSLD